MKTEELRVVWDTAHLSGRITERKRIIALAKQWAIDYEGGAEGAGMPDFDFYLLMAKAMRQFAKELEKEE